MAKNKPLIYTIATAHLDTSWLWTLEQTIEEYIPDTFRRNFEFFEKFPEYKFNFEGSYRYELIKEYYPEDYEKIKKYIKEGKWNPCGSCYENGDVNIPSPEALIRNILYGNGYFKKEFGIQSNDIFLPDCFGFGRALPSVAAHCGLTGFSTGKLFWGSSVPIPFDTGRWTGPDGKGIWAALMPFSYTTVFKKLNKAERILNKMADNKKKNLPDFTFAYHGIGDRGGAPHKASVNNVITAQRNNDNAETQVISASATEYFDMLEDLNDDVKSSMPVYDGEFLLTAHGAGSYTSRNVTKRWNKRCELLADAAERFASAAYVAGLADYPSYGFDTAWKKVIAHHFHDDITGTSFEECYKRNHNDYVQAMNTFSAEYTSACKALAAHMDTSFVKGIPVVVSNPLQSADVRKDTVSVIIENTAKSFSVFDKNGNEVPSQTKVIDDNKREVVFAAEVLSCGIAVYDIREKDGNSIATGLSVTQNSLENKYIAVKIDENGDISSVYDKTLGRELLKSPVRLAVLNNTHSFDWPAWEVKYGDLTEKPYMYAEKPQIKIVDNGDALCSLEIIRTAGKSRFVQIVSLGCESRYVSVYNETDWREEASLLKAEFSFTSANDEAAYDIGMGCTKRKTNTEKLYEVPAQKWADITDENGGFGVAVFSDSRAGWDKPDKSTLRLTVAHTPMANYRWECSQHIMDLGINRYSFALMGHKGSPDDVSAFADSFCQPMHTFITDKHDGKLGNEFSFVSLNNDKVRITAVKKAQDSDRIILRVTECSGSDINGVKACFASPVTAVFEVQGDETEISRIETDGNRICFDMSHNSIRSFAVEFGKTEKTAKNTKVIELDCNATGITADSERHFSDLKGGVSLPAEIMPDNLLFAGVDYSFSKNAKNCIVCDGREIAVGEGFDSVHLLAASLDGDRNVRFECGAEAVFATVPDSSEMLGHWDLMQSASTGYIKPYAQAMTLTHTHGKNGNLTAKQFYLFDIKIDLNSASSVKLPKDENIVIFAATAVKNDRVFKKGDEHFDSLKKREFDYEFSPYAIKLMNPNKLERFLNKFLDSSFVINVRDGEFYNKYSLGELYYIVRNLCNKARYKKNVDALLEKRKK